MEFSALKTRFPYFQDAREMLQFTRGQTTKNVLVNGNDCCASYTVLCYAMLCYAMLCYAMLCYAMLCYAMLCYAMLCYAMLCYAMLCYAMLCYAMLCCSWTTFNGTALCCVLLKRATLYLGSISVAPSGPAFLPERRVSVGLFPKQRLVIELTLYYTARH